MLLEKEFNANHCMIVYFLGETVHILAAMLGEAFFCFSLTRGSCMRPAAKK